MSGAGHVFLAPVDRDSPEKNELWICIGMPEVGKHRFPGYKEEIKLLCTEEQYSQFVKKTNKIIDRETALTCKQKCEICCCGTCLKVCPCCSCCCLCCCPCCAGAALAEGIHHMQAMAQAVAKVAEALEEDSKSWALQPRFTYQVEGCGIDTDRPPEQKAYDSDGAVFAVDGAPSWPPSGMSIVYEAPGGRDFRSKWLSKVGGAPAQQSMEQEKTASSLRAAGGAEEQPTVPAATAASGESPAAAK